MKNNPIATEDRTAEPSAGWRSALALFDSDLQRRGMAEKTRRAYGFDVGQFALWSTNLDLEPAAVDPRVLRRYAALLSDRRMSPTTVARKLAALRSLYPHPARARARLAQPGRPDPGPEAPVAPAAGAQAQEVAALLDRIPATTPLELRDRALFELAYASGLRAEELVNLDVGSIDFDGEEIRVEGKGSKTRIVPAGEAALRALARYLERARPALATGDGDPALFLSKSGRRLSTSDVRRRLRVWARHAAVQGGLSPARPAPLVRDPSARRRSRPAGDPGDARARQHLDDPDLHSGRVGAAEVRVRKSHPRA